MRKRKTSSFSITYRKNTFRYLWSIDITLKTVSRECHGPWWRWIECNWPSDRGREDQSNLNGLKISFIWSGHSVYNSCTEDFIFICLCVKMFSNFVNYIVLLFLKRNRVFHVLTFHSITITQQRVIWWNLFEGKIVPLHSIQQLYSDRPNLLRAFVCAYPIWIHPLYGTWHFIAPNEICNSNGMENLFTANNVRTHRVTTFI